MKKTMLVLLSIIALSFQSPQQQPGASVKLSIGQWEFVLQAIHDSPTPGPARDGIMKEIIAQINAQQAPAADTTKRTPADSTSKKSKSKPKQ